jgi:hypothetical protein
MHKPSAFGFFNNFNDSDLPLLTKIRLAAKNTAIKARTGSSCCGNHGEPGC